MMCLFHFCFVANDFLFFSIGEKNLKISVLTVTFYLFICLFLFFDSDHFTVIAVLYFLERMLASLPGNITRICNTKRELQNDDIRNNLFKELELIKICR